MDDPYAEYRQAFYSQIGERFETFEDMRRLGPAFRKDARRGGHHHASRGRARVPQPADLLVAVRPDLRRPPAA